MLLFWEDIQGATPSGIFLVQLLNRSPVYLSLVGYKPAREARRNVHQLVNDHPLLFDLI